MIEQIEKLKQEKKKLKTEYKVNQKEYMDEIKRIDKAIKYFEAGVNTLNNKNQVKLNLSKSELSRKRQVGLTDEIENILKKSDEAKHVSAILEKLEAKGFRTKKSSVSATLQIYSKKGKRFKKVAPATFTNLHPEADTKVKMTGKL